MAGNRERHPLFSAAKRILVSLILGANLVTLLLLWACCISTWIDPATHPRVSVIGLFFPVFLLLNVAFLLIWLLYKPRMLLVPLMGMVFCGGYILDYFPLNFGGKSGGADLKVMSWNAGYFQGLRPDSFFVGIDYIMNVQADIVCVQEAQPSENIMRMLKERSETEGYHFERQGTRLLISRYPVLSRGTIETDTKMGNGIVYYNLLMENDTVTLLNAHLECYHLSADEKDEYGDVLHSRDRYKMKSEAEYLIGRLASSSRYRAKQVQAVNEFLDNLPQGRKVMLCGDFNDTPISYTYQQVKRHLKNAYRAGGRGVGLSYREKNFPVRIDHIFYSSDWKCAHAYIDNSTDISDHYPIIAELKNWQK